MAFPPLVFPPGFIDESGGGVGGGIVGGISGAVGAAGVAFDFLGLQVNNLLELIRPLWPPKPNQPQGPTGGISTPNELKGPANFNVNDNGGRWAGIPGSSANWEFKQELNRTTFGIFQLSRVSHIPATHTVVGPRRLPVPIPSMPSRFMLVYDIYSPAGVASIYDVSNNQGFTIFYSSDGQWPFLISSTSALRAVGTQAFIGPTPEPERKRYPPISPPQPATTPPPSPSPATTPQPAPSVPPFPETPSFPTPAPAPTTTPEPTPGPTPGPQPSPNPQTTPQPATTPSPSPFPLIPVVVPQVTPNTTTQTNADGSRQTAALPGAITTPVGNEKIGPVTITTNAPQATLAGIAGEVGRIEQKLAKMIRPPADGDLTDRLGLIGSVLKAIYEEFFTGLPAGGYILSSSCEKDEQGDRIEYQVPILATQNRFDAIYERLDALADLIQTHKDLKQPICRGTQPTGQPVTVNFTQIE